MTRRVAVICATHPLPNPGMASSEIGFHAFWRRNNFSANVDFFRLYSPDERNPETSPERRQLFQARGRLPIEYRSLRAELEYAHSADVVLFWGDFLHSRDFLIQTAAVLERCGAVDTLTDATRLIYRSLYLSELSPESMSKAVLFGESLLFNSSRDYNDSSYASELTKLLKKSSGVWMRDVYSFGAAQSLAGFASHIHSGVDCAMLFTVDDLDLFPCAGSYSTDEVFSRRAAVFFGRSTGAIMKAAQLSRAICHELEVTGEWLPWFDDSLIGQTLTATCVEFPELAIPLLKCTPTSGDLLRRLHSYDVVVTDTYHLCVNAWNLGVPAICIGESFPFTPFDVSAGWYASWRDKRQVFYAMCEAAELYTTLEELQDSERFQCRLKMVVEVLRDDAIVRSIVNRIRKKSLCTEVALQSTLKHILGAV